MGFLRSTSSAARTRCGYDDVDGVGTVVYEAQPDVFDDGPAKPVRIWSSIGRRSILAAGNSNGDIPHAAVCFASQLPERGWRVVSVRDDWPTRVRGLTWGGSPSPPG